MDKTFLVEKDILFYALRYAIGRRTFAPTVVIDNIESNLFKFTKKEISMMIKEINEIKLAEGLGDDVDKKTWENFIKYLEEYVK